MKLIIVAVVVCIASISVYHQTEAAYAPEQVKAALKMATDACLKENTLTDDERKIVTENKFYDLPTPSKNVKCFSRCFNQMISLLGENGRPNENDFITMMKNVVKDKGDPKALFDKCAFDAAADACDASFNWAKCINAELTAMKVMM